MPVSAKKLDGVSLSVGFNDTLFQATVDGIDDSVMSGPPYGLAIDSNKWVNVWKDNQNGMPGNIKRNNGYVTMTFTVGDGTDLVDVAFDWVGISAGLYGNSSSSRRAFNLSSPSLVSMSVDGEQVKTDWSTEYEAASSTFSIEQYSRLRTVSPWAGKVSRTFSFSFIFDDSWGAQFDSEWSRAYFGFRIENLTVNDVITPIENIELKIGDIAVSVEGISDSVVSIDKNLNIVKNQLSNPSSPIWQSGAGAISNKIKDLFTPSAGTLTTATEQLKDTVKDKLGGAYDAVDAVTNGGEQMRDKLKNPTPKESITFPGISVPKAGMVEGFTILPAMEVSLPPKLTAVLQPVAGAIVCVLVGMYTLSSLKDMVVCLMSSMSYGEYLHRNKGGGSE